MMFSAEDTEALWILFGRFFWLSSVSVIPFSSSGVPSVVYLSKSTSTD